MNSALYIGCAGWNIPAALRSPALTYLERYAERLNCVEINSSFYRHHRRETYARWASSTPEAFRFSVKIPKAISHTVEAAWKETLERFLDEVSGLGIKLGALLAQFPPKRGFEASSADYLFKTLRKSSASVIAVEPRHPSWYTPEALKLYASRDVSPVAADPQVVPEAPNIFSSKHCKYFRLHGAPKIYYSNYDETFLNRVAAGRSLTEAGTWVIFDNTAAGFAFQNAVNLRIALGD